MQINEYLDWLLGDGFVLDEGLVVGPYPSPGFFLQLLDSDKEKSGYPRSKLTILADDGWDQEPLEVIVGEYRKRKGSGFPIIIHRVASENRIGLVHAKLYFFKLCNSADTYSRRILLIGSANASSQGFGVHAETYISVDLADIDTKQRREVVEYLRSLENGNDVPEIWFSVGKKKDSWVMLPAIQIVPKREQSGFDAWLRRGHLCHKYQRDPNFGKLALPLKHPLPKEEMEARIIRSTKLRSESSSQSFSSPYAATWYGDNSSGSNDDVVPGWRERYFLETYYGYWVSADCFTMKHLEFTESRALDRSKMLEEIHDATDNQQAAWLDEFRETIGALEKAIAPGPGGKNPNRRDLLKKYVELKGDHIDVDHYCALAKNKLERDWKLTNDAVFWKRFRCGYEFPPLPPLGDYYEEFALDFCQTLLTKVSKKRRSKNRLARILQDHYSGKGSALPEEPADLLKDLRGDWGSLRIMIVSYWKDTTEE
jgi:hypothetical protein